MNNHHRPHSVPEPHDEHEQAVADALDTFITTGDDAAQPTLPTPLDPDDQAAFAMAARLRQQLPFDAAAPSAAFVADLGERLAATFITIAKQATSDNAPLTASPPVALPDTSVTGRRSTQRPPSRRAILAGGLSAAAGLAAGVAGGILVERATDAPASSPTGPWNVALVGGAGEWQAVANVAAIAPGGVKRFTTTSLVGHLIRRNDGSFTALSAACTHMGCIVAWNAGQQTFDCPCHNGRFDGQGTALPNQPFPYRPLPTIATKVADDVVYVWVPAPPSTATTPAAVPASGDSYGHRS